MHGPHKLGPHKKTRAFLFLSTDRVTRLVNLYYLNQISTLMILREGLEASLSDTRSLKSTQHIWCWPHYCPARGSGWPISKNNQSVGLFTSHASKRNCKDKHNKHLRWDIIQLFGRLLSDIWFIWQGRADIGRSVSWAQYQFSLAK